MEIRKAEIRDIPAIVLMGQSFYEEAGYERFAEYDYKTSFDFAKNAILSPKFGAFIAEDELGFVIGFLHNYFFNSKIITGQEIAWWAEPSARGTKAGMKLFKALDKWAEDNGAHTFNMLSIDRLKPEKLDAFYRKNGYELIEHTYIKKFK